MLLYVIVAVLVLVCYKMHKQHRFWKEQKVLFKKPVPLFGNIWKIITRQRSLFDFSLDLYNQFPGKRYYGHYQFLDPLLVVKDLDLVKQVCIKDFDHFYDHKPFGNKESDPVIFRTMFNLLGEEWKQMRSTVSPAFTSRKMRGMFIFMNEIADAFTKCLLERKENVIEDEMYELFSKYTNDIIASVVFGIRQDSLNNPSNEFYQNGLEFSKQGTALVLSQLCPTLYKVLGCRILPDKVVSFFTNVVIDNMAQREKLNIIRPDMIHLLMEAQKGRLKTEIVDANEVETGFATAKESTLEESTNDQKATMTLNDILAQAVIFYIAGFDTVSSVMSVVAYEMALNPDCQERLHQEIEETWRKTNGKLTYEDLLGMKYLDQVVSETLRKWPPGFHIERLCTKDYTILPETGDEPELLMKPGQELLIPVAGIHRDPKYFPNPMKFDPDRFSDENKSKIVPGSYMPFGVGPRNCIGSRFALLEVKVMFFHILLKFNIVPVEKTLIPLKFSAKSFNIKADGGLRLGFKPRQ